jgi:hypothetical protein
MNYNGYKLKYPEKDCQVDQDKEWITLISKGCSEKIRLHDYEKFYKVPGLYEEVLYEHLQCSSPQVLCSMLKIEIEKSKESTELQVLDIGAENGMVGECLEEAIGL